MTDAYIKAIEYYLPEKIVTNADLENEFPEWTDEKIFAKVGIRARHIAASDETALDMAVAAAEKIFASGKIAKSEIDFVLFCTQSPDYKLPTSANIAQHRLGLPKNCGAFDFNLGCSGFVYGLALAKSLVVSGAAHNVLLLTGETYSKYIHQKDKGNRSLFGDAGTAAVISTEGFAKIGESVFGTDGSGYDKLIVKNGGAKFSEQNCTQACDMETHDENGNIICDDNLYMDGASIFSFTLKAVPPLVHNTLIKNALQQDDVDLFVFHQANMFMLEHLRKKLKIPKENFFCYLENVGNTVSCTIPIALAEAQKAGKLTNDANVMLAGFGVGLSWAGCVLKIVKV